MPAVRVFVYALPNQETRLRYPDRSPFGRDLVFSLTTTPSAMIECTRLPHIPTMCVCARWLENQFAIGIYICKFYHIYVSLCRNNDRDTFMLN